MKSIISIFVTLILTFNSDAQNTAEDLKKHFKAYAEGSVAFNKFPGGTNKLAQAGVLRPGVTFYQLSLVEPGKDLGMRFDLFYHDGSSWKMLGPIWRLL